MKKNSIRIIFLVMALVICMFVFAGCKGGDNFDVVGASTISVSLDKDYAGVEISCPGGIVTKVDSKNYTIGVSSLKQIEVIVSCDGYENYYKQVSTTEIKNGASLNVALTAKVYKLSLTVSGPAMTSVKINDDDAIVSKQLNNSVLEIISSEELDSIVVSADGYKPLPLLIPNYENYELDMDVALVSNSDSNKVGLVIVNDLRTDGDVNYSLQVSDVIFGEVEAELDFNYITIVSSLKLDKNTSYAINNNSTITKVLTPTDYTDKDYIVVKLSEYVSQEVLDSQVKTFELKNYNDKVLSSTVWYNNKALGSIYSEKTSEDEYKYFVDIPASVETGDVLYFYYLDRTVNTVSLTSRNVDNREVNCSELVDGVDAKEITIRFVDTSGIQYSSNDDLKVYVRKDLFNKTELALNNGQTTFRYINSQVDCVTYEFTADGYEEAIGTVPKELLLASDDITITIKKLYNVKIKYQYDTDNYIKFYTTYPDAQEHKVGDDGYYAYSMYIGESVTQRPCLSGANKHSEYLPGGIQFRVYNLQFIPYLFEYNQDEDCYYYTIEMQRINDITFTVNGLSDPISENSISTIGSMFPSSEVPVTTIIKEDKSSNIVRYSAYDSDTILSDLDAWNEMFILKIYENMIGQTIFYTAEYGNSQGYYKITATCVITREVFDSKQATLELDFMMIVWSENV